MNFNTTKIVTAALALSIMAFPLVGCNEEKKQPNVKNEQAQKALQAANSLKFAENAEIDNIKRRLELTSNPGQIGYIVLLNESGVPILYEGVVGKVTSGSKRLTPSDKAVETCTVNGCQKVVMKAPSDEGTYGESNPYIFYTNTSGAYRQYSGHYFYSDQPIRLNVEPLMVSITNSVK